jgi:hypothetical protein
VLAVRLEALDPDVAAGEAAPAETAETTVPMVSTHRQSPPFVITG